MYRCYLCQFINFLLQISSIVFSEYKNTCLKEIHYSYIKVGFDGFQTFQQFTYRNKFKNQSVEEFVKPFSETLSFCLIPFFCTCLTLVFVTTNFYWGCLKNTIERSMNNCRSSKGDIKTCPSINRYYCQ